MRSWRNGRRARLRGVWGFPVEVRVFSTAPTVFRKDLIHRGSGLFFVSDCSDGGLLDVVTNKLIWKFSENKENQTRGGPELQMDQIRAQFPALKRTYNGKPVVYLDGPGGSQVVQSAIEAIAAYMTNGGANLHGAFPSSRETEDMISDAKQAVADFAGARADEVAFGANTTTLAFAIARSLGRTWKPGDEIVVTEMDHRANVDSWIGAAEDRGVTVRWIKVDPNTLTLDLRELDAIITERTRLVAVGMASNAVGTIIDSSAIVERARKVGALVAYDAVHAAPHFALDRDQLDADILLFSAYKFFGPHVGIAVIRSDLFERLAPYKLKPAPGYVPDKLETGTQNHEGIAGVKAAIDFIAGLGDGDTRRERIVSAFERIEAYENRLADYIRRELAEIPGVHLCQAPADVRKTPTIAFLVNGLSPREVCERMSEEHSIFIAEGDFYASTLAEVTGMTERGGWIRAGLAVYSTEEEAQRFVHAVKELAGTV
jgi:cysteine desulfurase family protein (TIGR01976 family)